MKGIIAQGAYFVVVAIITYFMEWLLSLMIGGILFTAADAPPGDISETGKLLYSVGVPVFYGFALYGLYFLLSYIIDSFKILHASIGVLFHIFITIYLIWNIVPDAF